MKTGTMVEYAVRRTKEHVLRFARLHDQVRGGNIDEAWLTQVESRDNIFPEIDFRSDGPAMTGYCSPRRGARRPGGLPSARLALEAAGRAARAAPQGEATAAGGKPAPQQKSLAGPKAWSPAALRKAPLVPFALRGGGRRPGVACPFLQGAVRDRLGNLYPVETEDGRQAP